MIITLIFSSFSVFDIVSDSLLFYHYFTGVQALEYVESIDDRRIMNQTNIKFGNASSRLCTFVGADNYGSYEFSCVEYNFIFSTFTLSFIYLPSINVVTALYGPLKAGMICSVWGFVMAIMFAILRMTAVVESENYGPIATVLGALLLILGLCSFYLGCIQMFTALQLQSKMEKINLEKILIFFKRLLKETFSLQSALLILIIPLSPIIFIIIKFIAIFKPKNKLIQSQAKNVEKGEAILEASPQLILQIYSVISH